MASSNVKQPHPTLVFIFGGSGDLNLRKLTPALFNLSLDHFLPDRFLVVGLGRTAYTDEQFRAHLKEGIDQFSRRKDEAAWKAFAPCLTYKVMDAGNADAYGELAELVKQKQTEWKKKPDVLFYLAVAPQLMPGIATNLGHLPLCGDKKRVRLVIEKPFGHDLASAQELNELLGGLFAEEQIYRIDHYLGKETVQNLFAFRFANILFEPIWNRQYIDHVQITAAETVGVEGRGGYYEGSGALRDMIQNHLLQVMCMIATEAPHSFEANAVRNQTVEVLHSIRPIEPANAIRGQYGEGVVNGEVEPAYRSEKDVAPDSATETFAAVKLYIDNWRWENVPFYLRTGKHLPRKTTLIAVQFKPAPHYAFPDQVVEEWQSNRLIISIAPDMDIRLRFQVKRPGQTLDLDPVEMVFSYKEAYEDQEPEAYETLLLDAMVGDATLFMRADQVEAAWKVVTPILENWQSHPPTDFPNYTPGTWGPEAAMKLIENDGFRWVTE